MIKSYYDKESQATCEANQIKDVPPQFCHLAKRIWRKVDILDAAPNSKLCEEVLGKKNYKPLKGKRKGQYAIRVNDQYRLCFRWGKDNHAYDVEVNKHYWD